MRRQGDRSLKLKNVRDGAFYNPIEFHWGIFGCCCYIILAFITFLIRDRINIIIPFVVQFSINQSFTLNVRD